MTTREEKRKIHCQKKLFNLKTIKAIIENEDIPLLISMLPSILILESIHNDELNCQDTVDHLLFGASIVMEYYMQKYVIENKLDIYQNYPKKYKNKTCFTDDWCKQYIFTTIAIASYIITENSLNIGSCSSHNQEHNSANIRRHLKQDINQYLFKLM